MIRKRKIRHRIRHDIRPLFLESTNNEFARDNVVIYNDDVMTLYDKWDTPTVIISDGAYGLNSFVGDPHSAELLPNWYEPHIRAWSEHATPYTTLWNTSVLVY
jgi:hypothetical protein